MSTESLLQLQRTYGNEQVQRLLQRAQDDKKENDERDQVEMRAPAKLSSSGEIEIDLSQLMDLRKFDDGAKAFGERVDEWLGIGHFKIDDARMHPIQDLEVTESGRVNIRLKEAFLKDVLAILAGDGVARPNLSDFIGSQGFDVVASLHTDLEDPEVKESDIALPSGSKDRTQPALLITLDGEIGKGQTVDTVKLEGAILMDAKLKDLRPNSAS